MFSEVGNLYLDGRCDLVIWIRRVIFMPVAQSYVSIVWVYLIG